MKYLDKTDPQVARLVAREMKRQSETLDLIPSENIASKSVMEALGSSLTNKYSEGYPAKRYYAGNAVIDAVELLAQERARKVFRLGKEWGVNVQALSGAPANMAAYFALLKPGDKFMALQLTSGGHLTHGDPVNFSGRLFRPIHYNVTKKGVIDYAMVRSLARRERPKLILAGYTAYPRTIDFAKFKSIAKEVKAYFMVDMAHIAGLVAAGVHPSPFPYADVVTTTTHKSLRGPRGALIFSRRDRMIKVGAKEISLARAIDRSVFPGLQGGPHDNQTAAIAVALKEAATPAFTRYGVQIVKNAKALAAALNGMGYELVSGGTDNHLILIDVTNKGVTGRVAQDRLEEAGIVVNRNTVPYEPRSPFDPSGIRIGTPSLTTRGMKEREMRQVASLMDRAIREEGISKVRKEVLSLCRKFPVQ
ncbi:MAG: serine hydroxymethyltransferase [bacterium]|nr:serine hydroxymethyltransferase [bacterium]